MDSNLHPSQLEPGQLAWALNATFRGALPTNRPGWLRIALRFPSEEIEELFETGRFQGALFSSYHQRHIIVIAGRVFVIERDVVSELTGADVSSPTVLRVWFLEAEEFVIIQDGRSAAWIYDGAQLRRSNNFGIGTGVKEIPTGTVMAYALGRIWVTLTDQRSFVASDLLYDPTGTPGYGRRDAILKFTANEYLAEGGAFSVPFGAGLITAMTPLPQLDTSLGHGPLLVFTEGGAFSINAPFDRTAWLNLQGPLQTVALLHNGALSDRGVVIVNGDVWYRSADGIRSFRVAQSDQQTWAGTPLSTEVRRTLDRDKVELCPCVSMARFEGRLLTTTGLVYEFNAGTRFLGVVSLDFNPIGGMGNRTARPVWEGLWTGISIHQLYNGNVGGRETTFAWGVGGTLWRLDSDLDYDFDTCEKAIEVVLETPAFDFDAPTILKRLKTARLWYDKIQDNLDFVVQYRPDLDPNWQTWHTWSDCAITRTCRVPQSSPLDCTVVNTSALQYRARKALPEPTVVCDQSTGKPVSTGYDFQIRLKWTGSMRLHKFALATIPITEKETGSCN